MSASVNLYLLRAHRGKRASAPAHVRPGERRWPKAKIPRSEWARGIRDFRFLVRGRHSYQPIRELRVRPTLQTTVRVSLPIIPCGALERDETIGDGDQGFRDARVEGKSLKLMRACGWEFGGTHKINKILRSSTDRVGGHTSL